MNTSCSSGLPKCVSDFLKPSEMIFMPKTFQSGKFNAGLIPLRLCHKKKTRQDIKNLRHALKECYSSLHSSQFESESQSIETKHRENRFLKGYANYLSGDSYVNKRDILNQNQRTD